MSKHDILGSDEKFNIHIGNVGQYHMEDMDFTAEFFAAKRSQSVIITKQQMIRVDEDNYLAPFSTENLSPGTLMCRLTVSIPDGHFPDGNATKILEYSLGLSLDK